LDDLQSVIAKPGCQMLIVGKPLDCARPHLRVIRHKQKPFTPSMTVSLTPAAAAFLIYA
jgi:hypothetical protein